MPRNVEIKARVTDLAEIERRASTLADQGPFELAQDDTFFPCPNGRLKLRELAPDHGQLIFYERPDIPGPKLSDYVIAPTPFPDTLRTALGRALGVAGRVRKHRRLYWVQNTRIHLDQVEGLGSFLELEVVLSEAQSIAEGEAIAHRLLSELGVPATDLIPGAYVDLPRLSHPVPEPGPPCALAPSSVAGSRHADHDHAPPETLL